MNYDGYRISDLWELIREIEREIERRYAEDEKECPIEEPK